MKRQASSRKVNSKIVSGNTKFWLWLSMGAAVPAIAGNVLALAVPRIYSALTPAFLPQALAQDIADLALVAPAWILLAILALRGSLRAYLLWLGVLTFTVYNYVIYTFSVPFGPLFLVWVAVLGLTLYALIGGVTAVDHPAVRSAFTSRIAIQVIAWFLIVTSILLALLWLSEDIPALLSGVRPQSVVDMALPTNPVHVLDLAFFLPAAILTAVWLLQAKSFAHTLAPAFLVFLILTGIPILLTPWVQAARGETAAWGVAAPIGTLTAVSLGLLVWLLSTNHTPEQSV